MAQIHVIGGAGESLELPAVRKIGFSDLTDALADSDKAGKGGVTRGPGAAKLNFGDETTEDGFKFKEEALPPARLQALKDSKVQGLSAGAPQKGGEAGPTQAGALAGSQAGDGSASTQVVLPRHRGAVERYFDRAKK